MQKRKYVNKRDRLIPCSCCGYPISQRHHLLQVHEYGENNHTKQLCANCHELYHLIYSAVKNWGKTERCYKESNGGVSFTRSQWVWTQLLQSPFKNDERFTKITNLVHEIMGLENNIYGYPDNN